VVNFVRNENDHLFVCVAFKDLALGRCNGRVGYILSVESFRPWFDDTLSHPMDPLVQAPHSVAVNLVVERVAGDRVRGWRVRVRVCAVAVAVASVAVVLVAAVS
jgi:hypothetical protein